MKKGSSHEAISRMFGAPKVDTFLGLPSCNHIGDLDVALAILGVPCATPYRSVGPYCADAPRAIRQAIAPYAANLHHVDFDLGRPLFPEQKVNAVDLGDLPFDPEDFAANRDRIRSTVRALLERGVVPIVIGGDDSVPIPMLEAYAGQGEFSIVQVDAHIDWRDEVDGERYGLSSNMRRASEMPHVRQIIQIGQRGIGSARAGDLADALAWGVEFVPARELSGLEMDNVLQRIDPHRNVIIAIDIDGLDPTVVPGVIGRGPGGLSYWQTVNLIQGVARRAKIAGFSLVEFMPERDLDGLGALVAARLVVNALGAAASPI